MNKPAFVELLRVLRNVDPKDFNMSNWSCGTTACAVGHAFSDPWFIVRGAYLVGDDFNKFPAYNYWASFRACEKFFDISQVAADELFNTDGTLDEVIKRIEDFMRKHNALPNN
jgi:hypothetical protein